MAMVRYDVLPSLDVPIVLASFVYLEVDIAIVIRATLFVSLLIVVLLVAY
ncbi:MAG: hypothetical protein ACUVWK_02295 [Nitrososphaerales archaeon]